MNTHRDRFGVRWILLGALVAAACSTWLPAVETQPPPTAGADTVQPGPAAPRPWTPEELDSLVAPIALYPDPLLAQALAASTYPLELVEAKQWLERHPDLKGKELTDAAAQQDWDPSVQAMVTFPDVLNRLTENIGWTTDLGNAFLAQQADVMDAVQRLRLEAQAAGKLRSTREQEVTAKVIEERTVVEIVPADPEVIYVPIYSPRVIWGTPVYYDYPALWYPAWPSAADYWISFGLGITLSWYYPGWNYWYAGGWPWGWGWGWGWGWPGWGWGWPSWGWHGWGWGCGWGPHGGVYYNGHFCDHYGYHHRHHGHDGRHNGGHHRSGQWQHDAYHRGGVPYRTTDVARRYGADGGRTAGARRSTGGDYASRSRTGVTRGGSGESAGRSAGAYRNAGPGAGRNVTSRTGGSGTVATNRSGDRTASVNRSFSRDATTGAYRNTVTGRTRSADGPSTHSSRAAGSGTPSSGGRVAGNASFARDRSAGDSGSRAYSSRSYGSGGAYGGSAYSGSRSSGARAYSSGGASRDRSYSGSPSYGNRSFSSGSSSGGRAYSGGGFSGSRSFSSRSYSAPLGGHSYSGGSRSFSGGGGSRSFSGGGGSRSFSGGGSRGGRR